MILTFSLTKFKILSVSAYLLVLTLHFNNIFSLQNPIYIFDNYNLLKYI